MFDASQTSQARIQGAIQLATIAASQNQPFEVTWTLADNTAILLTTSELISVGLSAGTHVITAHTIGRNLRAAVENATTIAEVDAITWPET